MRPEEQASRAERHSGLKLLREQRFTKAAVAVEAGDDAAWKPIGDDPLSARNR